MGKGTSYAVGAGIAGTAAAAFLGPGAVFVGLLCAGAGGIAGGIAGENARQERLARRAELRGMLQAMNDLRVNNPSDYLAELRHIRKEMKEAPQHERDGFRQLLIEADPASAHRLLSDIGAVTRAEQKQLAAKRQARIDQQLAAKRQAFKERQPPNGRAYLIAAVIIGVLLVIGISNAQEHRTVQKPTSSSTYEAPTLEETRRPLTPEQEQHKRECDARHNGTWNGWYCEYDPNKVNPYVVPQ